MINFPYVLQSVLDVNASSECLLTHMIIGNHICVYIVIIFDMYTYTLEYNISISIKIHNTV